LRAFMHPTTTSSTSSKEGRNNDHGGDMPCLDVIAPLQVQSHCTCDQSSSGLPLSERTCSLRS
jgi:hypothetical protein